MSIVETKFKPYKQEKEKGKSSSKKNQKEKDQSLNNNSVNNINNVSKNCGFRYPSYLSDEEVKEGLENGSLIKV